jgi:glycosyltransferase involved in cell wall biosynthesis
VRALYFGTYERDYPRNAQVISCLRGAGVEVIERHVPVWEGREHKFRITLGGALRLARAELRLRRRPSATFDVLVVGYPGHFDMSAARHVAAGRPIVFNPLVSLEDTLVGDRGVVSASSLRARAVRMIDRRAFLGANLVVADTDGHAEYFASQFELPRERVAVCFVGADDALFEPGPGPRESSTVIFVGKLIPLHGVDTILGAAKLLPEMDFRIVGSGQLDALLTDLPANVRHEPWAAYEDLPALYRSASCSLGIFGTSEKAARVIPNKAFQALATATPLITADTPAARELLQDERNAVLVPPGNAEALAAAIRRVAADDDLRRRLAEAGRATYLERASEPVLGARWRELLEQLVG